MEISWRSARRNARTLVAAVAVLSVALLPAAPASAGSDGQDPTYCSGNSSPTGQSAIVQQGEIAGYVELRYSTGCGIAWSRVCVKGGYGFSLRQIYRFQPTGHTYSNSSVAGTNVPGTCANGFGAGTSYSFGAIDTNCTSMWGASCLARAYGRSLYTAGGLGYSSSLVSNGDY